MILILPRLQFTPDFGLKLRLCSSVRAHRPVSL
jgi:hypothetical protein